MGNSLYAKVAEEHNKDIEKRLSKEIEYSIKGTKIYGPGPVENCRHRIQLDGNVITLVPQDSVSCLFTQKMEGRVAVLNFASYKNPGGGYLSGMTTQEEALCHESTLYQVISPFISEYYSWNRANLNKGLYTNRALYSPHVVFEHKGCGGTADVITCAAPNANVACYRQKISRADNDAVFKDRIKFVLDIAEDNCVDTLILGAWGCGVFGQNPYTTCEIMNDLIENGGYCFSQIYYAIPGGETDGNYVAFEKVMLGEKDV